MLDHIKLALVQLSSIDVQVLFSYDKGVLQFWSYDDVQIAVFLLSNFKSDFRAWLETSSIADGLRN